MKHDKTVAEQIAYYRQRAPEYDEWFERNGRYNRGAEHTAVWQEEVAQLQAALAHFDPSGDVLELASGTGWWTEQLVKYAESVTAVDASPETIALNQQKVQSDKVAYIEADIFAWEPTDKYDVVFFSFWLSHVPPERFAPFWEKVGRCLNENGRVFLIDSLYTENATAKDQTLNAEDDTVVTRYLNDGSTFDIVKIFYTPRRLDAKLRPLGWHTNFKATAYSFVYGSTIPMFP